MPSLEEHSLNDDDDEEDLEQNAKPNRG